MCSTAYGSECEILSGTVCDSEQNVSCILWNSDSGKSGTVCRTMSADSEWYNEGLH